MSQLADQVAEIRANTAQLLDAANGTKRCRTRVCHPDGPCNCPPYGEASSVPDNFATAPVVGSALLSMRAMLNTVPAGYWQVGPTKLSIACGCRRAYRVPRSVLEVECKCGRIFFWSGRRLYVLKPEYTAGGESA